jgi:hypothetical protein
LLVSLLNVAKHPVALVVPVIMLKLLVADGKILNARQFLHAVMVAMLPRNPQQPATGNVQHVLLEHIWMTTTIPSLPVSCVQSVNTKIFLLNTHANCVPLGLFLEVLGVKRVTLGTSVPWERMFLNNLLHLLIESAGLVSLENFLSGQMRRSVIFVIKEKQVLLSIALLFVPPVRLANTSHMKADLPVSIVRAANTTF